MAKKLYEEENIRAIANTIREKSPYFTRDRVFLVADMPEGIRNVYEEGHNDGYNEGYNEGWNDGFDEGWSDGYSQGWDDGIEEGGGSGLVWELNYELDLSTLPDTQISFTSNGEVFNEITVMTISSNPLVQGLYFMGASVSRNVYLYNPKNTSPYPPTDWVLGGYQTITFNEVITDGALLDWLNNNATKVGGGGSGELHHLLYEQIQSNSVITVENDKFCYPVNIFGSSIDYNSTFDDYVYREHSSASSNPLTYSVDNNTDLYLYLYVRATDAANEESYVKEIKVAPWWSNSVDFISKITFSRPCDWYMEIIGARFAVNEL